MKGHSKIELTDVNTGAVEVFEDDNLVTNALNKILSMSGNFVANPLSSDRFYKKPIWRRLLGGILLFGKNIEEDAENITLNQPNNMVGNGCVDYASISTVTNLGSWNENESGVQEDGSIKLVYDFSTAQANGTIKCVCLTNDAYGFFGTGNSGSDYIKNPVENNLSEYFSSSSDSNTLYSNSFPEKSGDVKLILFIDVNNNCYYMIDKDTLFYNSDNKDVHFSKTGVVKVLKKRFWFKNFSINDCINNGEPKNDNILEEISINVPQEVVSYFLNNTNTSYIGIIRNSNHFYINFAFKESSNFGNNYHILKVGRDFVTEDCIITNNFSSGFASNSPLGISDEDYLYVRASSGLLIYKINIHDSTDTKEIVDTYNIKDRNNFIFRNNKLYCNYGWYVYSYYIDLFFDEEKVTNGNFNGSFFSIFDSKNELIFVEAGSNNDNYMRTRMAADYLATINNLEEPVTKTADKTMKVTYTLTFDEQVEE